MSDWKPGDKALCIRIPPEKFGDFGWFAPNGWVQKGTIYLVQEVGLGRLVSGKEVISLHICGLPVYRTDTINNIETGWNSEDFRKIVPARDRNTNEQEQSVPHVGRVVG